MKLLPTSDINIIYLMFGILLIQAQNSQQETIMLYLKYLYLNFVQSVADK